MVREVPPLVRFDGYHVLADLTGVPDLFGRIGAILASFLPGRRSDPRVTQLKPWARLLVTAWVLVVVPVLGFSILAMVLAAPRLVGTAFESLGRERDAMAQQWASGQSLNAAGAGLAMAIVAMAVLAMGLMAGRVVVRLLKTLWRRTDGRPA